MLLNVKMFSCNAITPTTSNTNIAAVTITTSTTTITTVASVSASSSPITLTSTLLTKMPPNGYLTLSVQEHQQQQQVISSVQSLLQVQAGASSITTKSGTATTDTAVAANILKYNCQEQKQLVDNINDTFNNYTDTFDLSLLPQEINHQAVNSATFYSNHLYNTNINLQQQQQPQEQQQNTYKYTFGSITPITTPEIKIEQPTWQTVRTTNNDIKLKNNFLCYDSDEERSKQNQLQVPFISNIIYPSPQSSPAQAQEYSQHHQYPHQHHHNQQNTSTQDTLINDNNLMFNLTLKSHNSNLNTVPAVTSNIKEEQFHILPPSPPESSYSETPSPIPSITINSNCNTTATTTTNPNFFSPNDIKSEPFETNVEKSNDLKLMPIGETYRQNCQQEQRKQHDIVSNNQQQNQTQSQQDYQVLREFLEDTTFQKKHNLKPLALDSIIGGIEEVPADIEPVIYLALQHVKREAEATCLRLQISHDPSLWSPEEVQSWLEATLQQFKLPSIDNLRNIFPETGHDLLQLSEEEFVKRVPECGSTLHAQLELWKLAYSDDYNKQHEQQQQHQHQQQENMYLPTLRTNLNNAMTSVKSAAKTITITNSNDISNSNNNNIQLELMVTEQNQEEQQSQSQQQQQQRQQQQSQDIWTTTKLIATSQHMDIQEESDDEENNFPNNLLHNTATTLATSTATSIILNSIKSLAEVTTATITTTTTLATSTATIQTTITDATLTSSTLPLLSTSPSTITTIAIAETTPTTTTIRPSCSDNNTIMKRSTTRSGGSHIHLWQFLKELLATPQTNSTVIRWLDRQKGIFKIEDSVRVAKLWGKRKNRPAMNYDKLSRSIRQYYKKGIMKKTERSQRLVYQFCQPYHT